MVKGLTRVSRAVEQRTEKASAVKIMPSGSTLVVKAAVRGYHVYRAVWDPHVGERFIVVQETSSVHDRYAMVDYQQPWRIVETPRTGVIVHCKNGRLEIDLKSYKIPWVTHGTDLSHPSHGCLMGKSPEPMGHPWEHFKSLQLT